MHQRNCTGGPLVFPTLAPPLEVEANGVIDLPDDLGVLPGFELVDPADEQPPADPPADPPAVESTSAKTKTTKRSAATTSDTAGEA